GGLPVGAGQAGGGHGPPGHPAGRPAAALAGTPRAGAGGALPVGPRPARGGGGAPRPPPRRGPAPRPGGAPAPPAGGARGRRARGGTLSGGCPSQPTGLPPWVPRPDAAGPGRGERAGARPLPWRLPRLYELGARFEQAGLRPLLAWLAAQDAAGELTTGGLTAGELAAHAFDHAWYSSFLDQVRVRASRYAAYPGGPLGEIAADVPRPRT